MRRRCPAEVRRRSGRTQARPEKSFRRRRRTRSQEAEDVLDEGVLAYLSEHANEIAAEADHAYQPIGGILR